MAEARNSVELGAFSFTRPRAGSIEVDGAVQIDLQVCHKTTKHPSCYFTFVIPTALIDRLI